MTVTSKIVIRKWAIHYPYDAVNLAPSRTLLSAFSFVFSYLVETSQPARMQTRTEKLRTWPWYSWLVLSGTSHAQQRREAIIHKSLKKNGVSLESNLLVGFSQSARDIYFRVNGLKRLNDQHWMGLHSYLKKRYFRIFILNCSSKYLHQLNFGVESCDKSVIFPQFSWRVTTQFFSTHTISTASTLEIFEFVQPVVAL